MSTSFKTLISFFLIVTQCNYVLLGQKLSFNQSQDLTVIKTGDTLISSWAGGINSAQISTMDLNNDQLNDVVIFDKN